MNTVAAVRLDEVRKSFGQRQALKGVSFSVQRGSIFGYLGANGAGKTTTIRILLDLLRPDSGSAAVFGLPTERPETRRKIGFLLDADGLYDRLSAIENLRFYGSLYGRRIDGAAATALLASMGLEGRENDRAGSYSKGMRRRLGLARALVHEPELLILDEPMSGIDPEGRIELRTIIRGLARDRGVTVLLSSHDLDEVQRLCDSIALLDGGELRLEGKLPELLAAEGKGRVTVKLADPAPAGLLEELERRLGAQAVLVAPETIEVELPEGVRNPELVAFLASRGLGVEGVATKEGSLQELYAEILRKREG